MTIKEEALSAIRSAIRAHCVGTGDFAIRSAASAAYAAVAPLIAAEAAAEEREACAKVADRYCPRCYAHDHITAAIRARGETDA